MITIWKYKILPLDGPQRYDMPRGAHVISTALDPQRDICFWALVDTNAPLEERTMWCVGTGWPLEDIGMYEGEFIGTVVKEPYVWHLFTTDNEN